MRFIPYSVQIRIVPLSVPDVLVAETPVTEVSRSLASQFLLLSVEGADGHEPKTAMV